jgi:Holliday junction resolvasome RuvABC endonuclease subunit
LEGILPVIICGIDPSLSGTGICFYDTKLNKLYASCITAEPSKGFEPLIAFALRIERLIRRYNPKIISIEAPFVYKGRINGAMRVFFLHAILRYLIYQNYGKALFYEYYPSSWKKKFTGHGNSSKGQVMWTALKDHHWKLFNSNISDAFGIMQAALSDYRSEKNPQSSKKAPSGNNRQRALSNKGRSE